MTGQTESHPPLSTTDCKKYLVGLLSSYLTKKGARYNITSCENLLTVIFTGRKGSQSLMRELRGNVEQSYRGCQKHRGLTLEVLSWKDALT